MIAVRVWLQTSQLQTTRWNVHNGSAKEINPQNILLFSVEPVEFRDCGPLDVSLHRRGSMLSIRRPFETVEYMSSIASVLSQSSLSI